LLKKTKQQAVIAEKFQMQLQQILQQVQQTGMLVILEERVTKGIAYFVKALYEDILKPLRQHIASLQYASKVRKYVTEVSGIEAFLTQQLQKIMQASYGDIVFCKDPGIYKEYLTVINLPAIDNLSKKNKPVKGNSQAESLVLFKEGKRIADIAVVRQLTESTVAGHLSMFVKTGELNVLELLTQEIIDLILPVVKEVGGNAVSPIKEILGDDFSYADIRIVLNHWHWLQAKKVNA
jgi:Helix-turn-helix domain